MNAKRLIALALVPAAWIVSPSATPASARRPRPVIIAHRGASGYLPEHSLVAKAMAYGQGADFIEQDVALTRDGVPVVIHDHYLDTVTDVATRYPERKRKDGRYYVIDFDLAEIRGLRLFERIDLKTGRAVYPGRFPLAAKLPLRIPTLDEEIRLIQGLNRSTGKNVGLYVELKAPWFHRREGRDLARVVLALLARHGYRNREDNIYLQCFDPACLRRCRRVLRTKLRLVQLVAANEWGETPGVDYDAMLTPEGLRKVASYADGLGPWIHQLFTLDGRGRATARRDLVRQAHAAGLIVHPYTVRKDDLPPFVHSYDELMGLLLRRLRVDGVFTDFPDLGAAFVRRHWRRGRPAGHGRVN